MENEFKKEKTFDQIEQEMKVKNFHYLKFESLFLTTFKKETKLFIDEQVETVDDIKNRYEAMYPDLDIEVIKQGKSNCYVFGKIKK